jgi:hypothetical protein
MVFRNKSGFVVRLEGKIIDSKQFDRLPNKVKFYRFPKKERQVYGEWQETGFIRWLDTTSFFVNVPANTIIHLDGVIDKFSLGLSLPDVLLIATTEQKTDTIIRENSYPVEKFKTGRRFLGRWTFYYDYQYP